MGLRVVNIDELVLDDSVYPRFKTSWLTVYQYAMAMKAGSVFPPVVVGVFDGKMYLVDGWHRVEALKMLGERYVQAQIKEYRDVRGMFADAVRLNIAHGRPLSVHEKVRIIDKLEDLGFTPKEISEITRIPVDKIERFKIRVVRTVDGRKIYLKSIIEKALGGETVEKFNAAPEVNQGVFNVRDVTTLLEQLAELLRSGLFPMENDRVRELAVEVYQLLAETLGVKETVAR
ncbi:MAG: ParB N-terminal domain-containing protein [Thermoproteota archaeon]